MLQLKEKIMTQDEAPRILVKICHRHQRCSTKDEWYNMHKDTYRIILNLFPIKYQQAQCDYCKLVESPS